MSPGWAAAVELAAAACVVAGLVSGGLALALTRQLLPAMGVAVDFWVAAGLLRLSLPLRWDALLAAAAVVAVRQVVGLALRHRPDPPPQRPPPGAP